MSRDILKDFAYILALLGFYVLGHYDGLATADAQQSRAEAQMQRTQELLERTQELLERTQERLDQSAALIVARCAAEGGVDCSVRVEGEL